jgi:hypothetical protein
MKRILVVANETVAGKPLIDAVRERAAGEPADVHVICPQNQPRHGYVIYDSMVRDAAENRLKMTLALLREAGIEADGEVMDPDPYAAVMDALGERDYDEIIISTHPETRSGWLRRDLIERVEEASNLPVTHVVADIDREGLPFDTTLVVANRTASSGALLDCLRSKARDGKRRVFIVTVPQEGGQGVHAARARAQLAQVIDVLRSNGLVAAGMIGDPDPYTATMNALQFFRVDDIVISTLPATRSGWLRADLIERVRKASNKPVDHVEAQAGQAAA